jgi:hypothetical protein
VIFPLSVSIDRGIIALAFHSRDAPEDMTMKKNESARNVLDVAPPEGELTAWVGMADVNGVDVEFICAGLVLGGRMLPLGPLLKLDAIIPVGPALERMV